MDSKQKRNVEAKAIAYLKMLGKSEKEIANFLGYSRMTIKRRMEKLSKIAPVLKKGVKNE